MSHRTIRWLVMFSALSIIGVVITQIYWINKILDIRNRQFSQQAHIALQQVAEELASISNVMLQKNPVEQLSPDYFLVNTNARTQPDILEHFLKESFTRHNLITDFEVGIYDCNTNRMQYGMLLSTRNNEKLPAQTVHWVKSEKYPYYFGVRFPNQPDLFPGELQGWMWSSILILVALGFFAYALFVILKQKHLSEIQRDFINNMTHELQTPISSIRIASEVLGTPEIRQQPERYQRYVQVVNDEIGRLQRQVEMVLTTAQAERNKLELRTERFNAHEVIENVVLKHKGKVHLELGAGEAEIVADKLHFSALVANLTDNALKYSGKQPEVRITTCNRGKKILSINISDKGIGIPAEHQKHIFEKFYRVPSGDVHNVKGFGIGLSYVKEIVRAHLWKLELKSEPGKGSEFCLLVNLA